MQTILSHIQEEQIQPVAVNKEVVQDESIATQHAVEQGQKMARVVVAAKTDEPRKDKTGSAKRLFLKKFLKR